MHTINKIKSIYVSIYHCARALISQKRKMREREREERDEHYISLSQLKVYSSKNLL